MFLCILINSRFSRFIRLDWFTPRFNAVVFNIWYYFGTSKPGRSDVLIFVFSSFSFIISTILFLYTSFSIAIIRLSLRACLLFGDALMIFCTVAANLSGNLRFCPFHSLHFLTKCEELSLLHIEFDLYLLYSSHIFCFSFFLLIFRWSFSSTFTLCLSPIRSLVVLCLSCQYFFYWWGFLDLQ